MMNKAFFPILVSVIFSFSAGAQTTLDQIRENPQRAAYVFHVYETFGTRQTAAPKGFQPFYISHYGRHGSRYLTDNSDFKKCIPALVKCKEQGVLTEAGQKLLADLQNIEAQHQGMIGFLTQFGSRQHQEISERMFRNFPQAFSGEERSQVIAISSSIQRCIQSMASFCTQLKGNNPELEFHYYTGDRYFDLLCHDVPWTPETRGLASEVRDSMIFANFNTARLAALTFNDIERGTDLAGIPLKKFFEAVFNIAVIGQNLDDEGTPDILTTYFTPEELAILCDAESARLYGIWYESTEIGNYRIKGTGAPILRDILTKADAAVAGNDVAADLRFGHDSGLAPLMALIKLQDNDKVTSVSKGPDHWQCFREMCMASNLQLIFLRNAKGEVIVKLLHNEREATVGSLTPYSGPYYRWSDLRAYFCELLAAE